MAIIDEKGRLFGVVNVVDALVVLVLLALVVAGVALVTGGTGGPPSGDASDGSEQWRFGTLVYTVPEDSAAATIGVNDTLRSPGGETTFTVTDVYRSYTTDGRVYVATRIRYPGQARTADGRLYGGDTVRLVTSSHRVEAEVIAVNQTSASIPTASRRVVLEANVSAAVADAIEPGDTATIGNSTVARITGVDRRQQPDGDTRVAVGVVLTVWERGPVPAFDGTSLRVGNRVTIVTDSVVIPGHVARIGTDDPGAVGDLRG